jgi:hypothetical protein
VVMEEREAIPILSWFVVRGAFVMTREGARRGAQEALVVGRKRRTWGFVLTGCIVTGRALSKAGEREKVSSSLRAKGGGSQDRGAANSASRQTKSRARWALVSVLAAGRIVLLFVGMR